VVRILFLPHEIKPFIKSAAFKLLADAKTAVQNVKMATEAVVAVAAGVLRAEIPEVTQNDPAVVDMVAVVADMAVAAVADMAVAVVVDRVIDPTVEVDKVVAVRENAPVGVDKAAAGLNPGRASK
jgi:hypothetical protein